ncbi:HhH-GPD family protein [Spirochaeta thermophila DSM 6578]|uniref:HhH-GPD family protein n=1 Tax=Winmispira thermophila (strain ATCC 700085 / DSM 6578 / Z-1203) TaxID=869211 RepID=G0GB58_WINT7|nr:DNA repair protein [Spirochaeta thermophila]AEJ61082.1 HhH-GPD family protein [Spirochaeta thermophila DSM 6578]
MGLGSAVVRGFQEEVLGFHRREGRDFPWRRTRDPYAIFVSEMMLQQTQTSRVVGKYGEFLARFPSWEVLAGARLGEVLEVWQGLGYNRRARGVWESARMVVEWWGGRLPKEPELLEVLPMVGPYTARAVATFAYGKPCVFIETNIRTVFLDRFFPGREGVRDAEILPLVEETLYRDDVRTWYYALMDVGAAIKARRGNAGRRSAHYRRQGRFEGSVRQVRGAVLRVLVKRGGCEVGELAERLGRGREEVEGVVGALEREGLVVREGGRVYVP